MDRETNRPKGYGYVTFADRESLKTALDAHDYEFSGRNLRIDVAEERADNRPERQRREPEASRADLVDKWERGKRQPQPQAQAPANRDRGDRPPRSNYGNSGSYGGRNTSSERKPLNLKPRSVDAPVNSAADAKKSDPFGGAKPRDEMFFQKKKEAEMAERGVVVKGSAPTDKKRSDKDEPRNKPAGKAVRDEKKPIESSNLYSVLASDNQS